MTSPPLVVVTGPPGAGKTTAARELARRLSLPLVQKDAIKEALFDSLGVGDEEWSDRLGQATFEVMFRLLDQWLEAGVGAVAEANFRRGVSERRLTALPPTRLVQLYCTAPDEVLVARYRQRDRHPGHLDEARADEVAEAIASGLYEALELDAPQVEVERSGEPDLDALESRIRAELAR